MSTTDKLTLSIPEAAKVLGVSAPTMYQLVKEKGFPIVVIGKRKLVSAKGLSIWLDEHTGAEEESNDGNNN